MALRVFGAGQFSDTEFDKAEQKAQFANHFVRFVQGDFKVTLFPKWFYKRLSMTFGHIAHYDQNGFYQVQFGTDEARLRFLRQTAEWPAFGSPSFTYSDVEKALAKWVRDNLFIGVYEHRVSAFQETNERAELARLKAKYEPKG